MPKSPSREPREYGALIGKTWPPSACASGFEARFLLAGANPHHQHLRWGLSGNWLLTKINTSPLAHSFLRRATGGVGSFRRIAYDLPVEHFNGAIGAGSDGRVVGNDNKRQATVSLKAAE